MTRYLLVQLVEMGNATGATVLVKVVNLSTKYFLRTEQTLYWVVGMASLMELLT